MEKTIFLFRKHPDRSDADFARHYIHNHAPLGARLTRCLLGYTVNIVEKPGGPDAVTEHWLPQAKDLFTPDVAYATREDFEAVVADDRTLFGGFDLYIVVEETYPVEAEPLDAPAAQRTPEAKVIWLYPDAASAPPPPPGARRVVDNRVGSKLVYEGATRVSVAPDIGLIRMAWGPDASALAAAAPGAIPVAEHRFIPAPLWRI